MLKIYCALSAECAPDRTHSTKVPSAALHRVWSWCLVRGNVIIYRAQKAIQEMNAAHGGGHGLGLTGSILSGTLASYGDSAVARTSDRGRVAEV